MTTSDSAVFNNPKWQTPQIVSTAKTDRLIHWGVAIAWNAFLIIIAFTAKDKILKAMQDEPIFYVFLLFPLIGLFVIYKAIQKSLEWKQYGRTPLTLDTFPGEVGGLVNGFVDIPLDFNANNQVKVALTCVRHYMRKTAKGGSESAREAVWQDTVMLRTEASIEGSRVRFDFQPPADLPETKLKGSETFEWNVTVQLMPAELNSTRAQTSHQSVRVRDKTQKSRKKGQSFKRKYIIPVVKTEQISQASSTQGLVSTTESVVDNNTTQARTKRAKNVIDVDHPIPEISQTEQGTRYHYPAYRSKGTGFAFAAFGLACFGFAGTMIYNVSDSLPVTMTMFAGIVVFIGVILVAFGVFIAANSLSTYVSPQGIKSQYKLFGFTLNNDIPVDQIADLSIKSGMSSNNGETSRVWYDVRVVDTKGLESTIGDGLEGSSFAESIRQKMMSNLGTWSAQEIKTEDSESKIDEINHKIAQNPLLSFLINVFKRVIPFLFPLAIAYDSREFLLKLFNEVFK